MTIEQFTVQPLPGSEVTIVVVTFIVVGVVLFLASLLIKRRPLRFLQHDSYALMFCVAIIGIALIIVGGITYYGTHNEPSSLVTVGDGYISVKSTYFNRGLGVNGVVNVTSDEIVTAFVGQIGSGEFTLHKRYGLNFDDTNVGMYTLGNGATAYIVSANSTNLIIQLKSGEYFIVGNQDTQTLANSFAQNVHPLAS
ncbi:MAG: hypothetical protein LBE70_04240 [Nitrososphaerota archaeon]|nr:hypothetical protein [Nitrososphaerota archaeon]